MWPGEEPIGKRLIMPRFDGRLWEVVGVARDSKYIAVFEGQLPHMYFAMRADPVLTCASSTCARRRRRSR